MEKIEDDSMTHSAEDLSPDQKNADIFEIIAVNMKDISAEEFSKLPRDGASEHDHYLYGHPKRNA